MTREALQERGSGLDDIRPVRQSFQDSFWYSLGKLVLMGLAVGSLAFLFFAAIGGGWK